MKRHALCCIGHITLDKVVTPQTTVYMPGERLFIVRTLSIDLKMPIMDSLQL